MKFFIKAVLTLCFLANLSSPVLAQHTWGSKLEPFGDEDSTCAAGGSPGLKMSPDMLALAATSAKASALSSLAVANLRVDVYQFWGEQCRLMRAKEVYYDRCPVGDLFHLENYIQEAVDDFGLLNRDQLIKERNKQQDAARAAASASAEVCKND